MTKEELEREYYGRRPTEPYSEDDSPNDWANIVQYAEENLNKAFKAIAELEKENAELKRQVENAELTKAKEIIKKFLEFVNNEVEFDPEHPQEHTDLWNELCEKAERFISENECKKKLNDFAGNKISKYENKLVEEFVNDIRTKDNV